MPASRAGRSAAPITDRQPRPALPRHPVRGSVLSDDGLESRDQLVDVYVLLFEPAVSAPLLLHTFLYAAIACALFSARRQFARRRVP
jgi:hypothetical protein